MKNQIVVLLLTVLCTGMICKNISTEILESLNLKPTKEVFKSWHYAFKRPYDLNSEEGLKKYRVFKDNIKYIKKINSEQNSYKLGLGPFADLTSEEFSNLYTTKYENEERLSHKNEINDIAMSDYFLDDIDPNWMDNLPDHSDKIVTFPNARLRQNEVYEERRCFLDGFYQIIKTMFESHINIRKLPFNEISYQNLFDCYNLRGEEKCLHGISTADLWNKYLRSAGLYTTKSYPMLQQIEDSQECKDQQIKPDYSSEITGCSSLLSPCTLKIKRKILKSGPAITRIYNEADLQHYSSGVFDSKKCDNEKNFVITSLIVHLTKDYVKVLFPFGQDYGDQGYVRLSREFTLRQELSHSRWVHSCGAESDMAVPHQLRYLKEEDDE